MKILKTRVGVEDLCWPVLFFHGITVDEGSSCFKLEVKDLVDRIFVWFCFLEHLRQSFIRSGLYDQTVFFS